MHNIDLFCSETEEQCGIVMQDASGELHAVLLTNHSPHPETTYNMRMLDVLDVVERLSGTMTFHGFIHTHPEGDITPSHSDMSGQILYLMDVPQYIYQHSTRRLLMFVAAFEHVMEIPL